MREISLCIHIQQTKVTSYIVKENSFSSGLEISQKRTIPLSSLCIQDGYKINYVFGFDVSDFKDFVPNTEVLLTPDDFMHHIELVEIAQSVQEELAKEKCHLPLYYLLNDIKSKYESSLKQCFTRVVIICPLEFFTNYSLIIESVAKECNFQNVEIVDECSILCYSFQHVNKRHYLSLYTTEDSSFLCTTTISSSNTFVSNYKGIDTFSPSCLIKQLINNSNSDTSYQAILDSLSILNYQQFTINNNYKIDNSDLMTVLISHQNKLVTSIKECLTARKWKHEDLDGILVYGTLATLSLRTLLSVLFPSIPIHVFSNQDVLNASLRYIEMTTEEPVHEVDYTADLINGQKEGYGEEFHFGQCIYRGFWKNDKYDGLGILFSTDGDLIYRGFFENGLFHGFGTLKLTNDDMVKGTFVKGILEDGTYTTYYSNNMKCYEGTIKNNMKSGIGKFYDKAGVLIYDGCYLNNKKNGMGRIYQQNGQYIEGSFIDDNLDGECLCYTANGILIQKTHYNHGNQEGQSQCYDTQGCLIYEGKMVNNEYYGLGVLYYPGGSIQYDGEFLHNQFNGYGQYYNKNGDLVYIGEFHSGQRDGQGKEYDEGIRLAYTGSFSNNMRNGNGKMFLKEGHFYEGNFVDNEMEGKGRMIWSNGQSYEGEFHHGKKEGKGVFTWSDSSHYEGEFKDDKRNGRGVQYNECGEILYDGEWQDDIIKGEGTLFFTNGCYYKGYVLKGKREGQGMQYNEQHVVEYKGEWKNDRPHGFGTYYYGNNCYYEGQWVNGEKEGTGRMHYSNGDYYIGMFKNGLRNGKGCIVNTNGKIVKEGIFENNQVKT